MFEISKTSTDHTNHKDLCFVLLIIITKRVGSACSKDEVHLPFVR